MPNLEEKVSNKRLRDRINGPSAKVLEDIFGTSEPSTADIAHHRALVDANIEMFRSDYLAAQAAIRSAVLVNAGSAVALLAFLGNLWVNEANSKDQLDIVHGLGSYVAGVLIAAVSSALYHLFHHFQLEANEILTRLFRVGYLLSLALAYSGFAIGSFLVYSSLIQRLST